MVAAVIAFAVPGVMGLVRYRIVVGLHTWSAKCAMAAMGVAVLLWFGDLTPVPFRIAVLILLWAGTEETCIMLLLKKPRTDVPTVFHALKFRRGESFRQSEAP